MAEEPAGAKVAVWVTGGPRLPGVAGSRRLWVSEMPEEGPTVRAGTTPRERVAVGLTPTEGWSVARDAGGARPPAT